jgi:hypothetical protein
MMLEPGNAVDEVLDELHEIRLAIDARFDHDVHKYAAHLNELGQRLLREGWVEAPPPSPEHVRRVNQALDRVRRNPHLLECGEDCRCAGGEDDQGTN